MEVLQIVVFVLVILFTTWILYKRINRIRNNIQFGRPENRLDQKRIRWKLLLLVAFGQKKMFKKPVPALLHLFVYLGFLIVNIEILEFVLDGVSGYHRALSYILNPGHLNEFSHLYNIFINLFEFLAAAVILVSIIFLVRRNLLRVRRFRGAEMKKWPLTDANLILLFEIILMLAILTMNAADQSLQAVNHLHYPKTGIFYLSHQLIQPSIQNLSPQVLVLLERITWWLHITGIFAFAIYITYSKHLHIILAFPNIYYTRLSMPAELDNMEIVTREVKKILEFTGTDPAGASQVDQHFGAKDINDLTWKNLMEAYACTECGRCTSVCPASITGKKLSPRKIMMDVRDRMEEVGESFENNKNGFHDGKTLIHDYISKEELFACTTCNACIETCPVNIDPVSVIIQLRRYLIMEESQGPAAWNTMFSNLETNFSPWKFPVNDRFTWHKEL